MRTKFFEKFYVIVKSNLLICFLLSFVLGGAVVYLSLQKRIQSNVVVEVSADSLENTSDNGNTENVNIYVDISGAVINPGVYEVKQGTRVGELIGVAGGVSGEASSMWVSRNLNLSKKVDDSSKIYIPFAWEFYFPEEYKISKLVNKNYASDTDFDEYEDNSEEGVGNENTSDQTDVSDGGGGDTSDSGGLEDSGKINVNNATSSELDSLPGIGPAYAEKIISNRPYKDIAELESKSGLYKSTIENIKDLITF